LAEHPRLATNRLVLRGFTLRDVSRVTRLVRDRAIADTTLAIPHPYEESAAREWISTHAEALRKGEGLNLAVVLRETGDLIGAVGLRLALRHRRAELGYWIGKPFWNQGYATEAARCLVAYGFDQLGLNRIFAFCFTRNPSSGRVLEKIGMSHEGRLRQHVQKWDVFEDLELYGVLGSEFRHRDRRPR
jgi:RimJ/RimL family protein N-acetyltransferase